MDGQLAKATGRVLMPRQIRRFVPLTKGTGTRQIHILATLKVPGPAK